MDNTVNIFLTAQNQMYFNILVFEYAKYTLYKICLEF